MRINNNIAALNAWRGLTQTDTNLGKSLEKLSSGLRINRAGDDAAGLAISEKMRGQIKGLYQASRNAQDGISLIQTAEGALNETHSILQRMRELAVQAANDTSTASDRTEIQREVDELAKEITRISNTTDYNTKNLLAGGFNSTLHIGANAGQSITMAVSGMDAYSLGVAGTVASASGFTAGTTGITSITNAGRGMETGTGYSIVTDNTAAALSAAIAKDAGGGDATEADASITDVAAYTGTTSTAYLVKVTTTDADSVSQIAYSTDGGDTWIFVDETSVGGGDFAIGNGLEFVLADNVDGYDTDTQFSFTVAPETTTFKLYDTDGSTQIGSTVTAYYGSSNVQVGDAESGQTVQVNYTYANLADGAVGNAATFNVVASASTAATVVSGEVTVEADTKAGIAVNSQTAANSAITAINAALTTVSTERSKLGAYQNRLEHTINNLGTAAENLSAAESRIRDVDMAQEMMQFTKLNILAQAGTAMLAQANMRPQSVLQLLQ